MRVNELACRRGGRVLFQDISFCLEPGELLHVVGCNGAGKTSLLRMLTGVLPFEKGAILWHGESILDIRPLYQQQLFYLGHQLGVKMNLTVVENIRFSLQLGSPSNSDIESAIDTMGLLFYRDTNCVHLSQGQQQRVVLAQLLLSQARLLILDEPFSALDSDGILLAQQLLEKKLQDQCIVILTTHRPLTLSSLQARKLDIAEAV